MFDRMLLAAAALLVVACGYPTSQRRTGSDIVVRGRARVHVVTAQRQACAGQPGSAAVDKTCLLTLPDSLLDTKRDVTEPPRPIP